MPLSKRWKIIFSTILGLFFSSISCTTSTNPDDPYETYNRHAYAFNHTMDKILIKPVAKTYNFILPQFVRTGISNFFNNLDEISTIIDDLLQAEFYHATSDTWRFAVNTTAGIGGFIDVAEKIDLQPHNNDFGLTLAKWGYQKSAYLVLPFLGPRTVRDTYGLIVDYGAFSVYPYINNKTITYSALVLWYIDLRAQMLRFDTTLKVIAFDEYIFERDAYLQSRNSIIRQNNGESEETIDSANTMQELNAEKADAITRTTPKASNTAKDPEDLKGSNVNNKTAVPKQASKSNNSTKKITLQ